MQLATLQVGINQTPGAPLAGCLNDLANLGVALMNRQIRPAEVRILTDQQATRHGILSALDALVSNPCPFKIFQYSGHGVRLRGQTKDKSGEMYDSAIVPYDYQRAGLILDDELATYYDRVPPGHQLIILSDSCHSGRSQRAFVTKLKTSLFHSSTPRVLPAHLLEPQIAAMSFANALPVRALPGRPRKSYVVNNERCLLIAACKAEQTAADAYINNQYQGAGTAALLWAWSNLEPGATYGEVGARANYWLKKNNFPQVLRMEGRVGMKDRRFLS